jgi:hypothetical protein
LIGNISGVNLHEKTSGEVTPLSQFGKPQINVIKNVEIEEHDIKQVSNFAKNGEKSEREGSTS